MLRPAKQKGLWTYILPVYRHTVLESSGAQAPPDNSQKPHGHRQLYWLPYVASAVAVKPESEQGLRCSFWHTPSAPPNERGVCTCGWERHRDQISLKHPQGQNRPTTSIVAIKTRVSVRDASLCQKEIYSLHTVWCGTVRHILWSFWLWEILRCSWLSICASDQRLPLQKEDKELH